MDKDSLDKLVSCGLDLIRSRDYEGALRQFDEALMLGPHCVAFYNKAFLLFHLGQHKEVIELLTHRIPEGLDEGDLNRLERLAEECGRRIGLHRVVAPRERPLALFEEGMAAGRAGSSKESAGLFAAVLDIDPAYYLAWNNRGHALMELGELEHAYLCVVIALLIDTGNHEAWCTLGEILARLNFQRQALACFEESYRLKPQEQHAAYILAQMDRWMYRATAV